jgi:RES domain
MNARLVAVIADGPVYRIGRSPDPWALPDWAFAGADGTFGNRFDDPESSYRVIYASSQRRGAFLETLARFRPDPHVLAARIAADPRDEHFETTSPGTVPAAWLSARLLGTAHADGISVDLGDSHSLAFLRERMAARILHYGLDDFDAAAIRLRAPRPFTQEISRLVYERPEGFAGIRYGSRLGDDVSNWALFEPVELRDTSAEPIGPDDEDLRAVVQLFGVELRS